MDTGIDIMVENIVMVRPTQSPILYQQMRGSRLDSRINKKSFRFTTLPELPNILTISYNPYSEIAKAVSVGTEAKDFIEEDIEVPAGFIQVAETAQENIDVVIKRAC